MRQTITTIIEKITDIMSHTLVAFSLLLAIAFMVVYGFLIHWPKEYADNVRLFGAVVSISFLVLNANDRHRTDEAIQAKLDSLLKEEDSELIGIENKPFEEAEKIKKKYEESDDEI